MAARGRQKEDRRRPLGAVRRRRCTAVGSGLRANFYVTFGVNRQQASGVSVWAVRVRTLEGSTAPRVSAEASEARNLFLSDLQKILMSSKAKSEYIELSLFGLINCAPDSSAEGGCV